MITGNSIYDWWYHQDNTPDHRTMLVTSYMTDRGINLVQNSTSNPDLPLCDIFFLPHMKDSIQGTQTGNKGGIDKMPERPAAAGLVGLLNK